MTIPFVQQKKTDNSPALRFYFLTNLLLLFFFQFIDLILKLLNNIF